MTENSNPEATPAETTTTPDITFSLGAERESFYASIICGFFEGEPARWAGVTQYHWWAHDKDGGRAEQAPGGGDNAYGSITRLADDPDPSKRVTWVVNLNTVDEAYVTLAANPVKGLDDIDRQHILDVRSKVLGGDESADADLSDADCSHIVQIGLFGEVIH